MPVPERPLVGKVALVAGATRGAGRGIAVALGEAGATVICSGRSSRATGAATSGRSETIEGTAERVSAAGGVGIAARTDHLREDEVRALAQRIRDEHGGLDVLVNDIWGGDADIEWTARFWQMDVERAWRVIETAIKTHLVTARHAAPLLIERAKAGHGTPLLVEVTDGDTYQYRGQFAYDLVKTSVIRMAFGMAHELKRHGVAAVAVTPGFLRSEAMLDHFGVTRETWRDAAKQDANFLHSETPLFVGRGVAALAADPRVMERTGKVVASWTLSDEYGFTDEDGARPHWGRHFAATYGERAQRPLDDAFYAYWQPPAALDEMMENAFGKPDE